MWRKWTSAVVVLAALGTLAGCSDGVTDPLGGGGASADELADLALQSDLLTEEIFNEELDAMGSTFSAATTGDAGSSVWVDERTFSRTRSCPGGGEMSVEGTIRRTFDPDSGVMVAESTGSRTRTDCTFMHGELSITVNGTAQWERFRRRVNGMPDGLQTSHYYGSSTAVRSDGEERSCEYDFTIVRDPETHTRTIDGTICGGRIRHGIGWHPQHHGGPQG